MFGIRNLADVTVASRPRPLPSGYCHLIEGSEVFDTLCPVSKLSGLRENPLQLLSRVLDPAKARLVDSVLQQIPSSNPEGVKISDEDALDLIMDRLSTGTPSEDAIVRNKLSQMVDVLLPREIQQEVEQKIEFGVSDQQAAVAETK